MNTKKKSVAQEKRGAKRHGGRVTPGSGNQPWVKNDMRTEDESWEYKRTDKKQYTVKHDELIQAERHALLDGRDFRFGLEMCDREWVLMPVEDYEVMKEKARNGSEAPG